MKIGKRVRQTLRKIPIRETNSMCYLNIKISMSLLFLLFVEFETEGGLKMLSELYHARCDRCKNLQNLCTHAWHDRSLDLERFKLARLLHSQEIRRWRELEHMFTDKANLVRIRLSFCPMMTHQPLNFLILETDHKKVAKGHHSICPLRSSL